MNKQLNLHIKDDRVEWFENVEELQWNLNLILSEWALLFLFLSQKHFVGRKESKGINVHFWTKTTRCLFNNCLLDSEME